MWEKQRTSTLLPPPQSAEAEFDPLCQLRPRPEVVVGAASTRRSGAFMTSHDALSLILRRLDGIERKLDCLLEELRTPAAIGYSARRGQSSKEGLSPVPSA